METAAKDSEELTEVNKWQWDKNKTEQVTKWELSKMW
jgi:hypothetical protein